MERKSETTRNHARVNNLTMISLSRSLMKHVIYINSEKLPGKSRPRSIPSLIKRDILRRKRYLVWSVTWFPFGLWTVIRYSAIISKTNNRKKKLLLSDINSLRQESHVKSWVLSFLTILGGGKQCDGLPMIHAFLGWSIDLTLFL